MKGLRLRGGCVQVEGTVVDEQVGVVQNAALGVEVECSGAESVGGVVKLLGEEVVQELRGFRPGDAYNLPVGAVDEHGGVALFPQRIAIVPGDAGTPDCGISIAGDRRTWS